jgi:hypothetical protein
LEQDLRGVLGVAGDDPGAADEIAAVLATAWAVDFRRATLPSLIYPLLASRLLCRLGRRQQARRLLEDQVPSHRRPGRLLQAMANSGTSLKACALLAAGVVLPDASSLCGQGATWVVDLGRLAGARGPVLELQVLGRLRGVLEAVAGLFDADAGAGQIVLAGAGGPGRGGRPGLPEGPEMCRFARDVLALQARRRAWSRTPGVHLRGADRSAN